MRKIRTIIFSRIFGLILLSFFGFSLISLFFKPNTNPPYDSGIIFFGEIGSYYAFWSYYIFGITSYLISIFFLIIGFKKTFGIEVKFISIRLIAFIISIILFCWLIDDISNLLSRIGIIKVINQSAIYNIIATEFTAQIEYLSSNKLLYFLSGIVIFSLAMILFLYGTSLKFKYISKLLYPVKIILNVFFKLLKITYLILPIKNLINFKKWSLFNFSTRDRLSNNLRNIKQEPTFDTSNTKKTNFFKSDTDSHSSTAYTIEYKIPSLSLLRTSINKNNYPREIEKRNKANAIKLESVLQEYGVTGKITSFKTGPVITLFEFQPSAGIKTSKVIGLATDIARSMSSVSARISSQPGKNSIGIEIPNEKRQSVYLGDLLKDEKFNQSQKGLILALGKNISGEKIYTDLELMPHLLIAGTTGSGKSVGINSMIISLLFRFKPSECKFILIDPKMLELSIYENIPHLLTPVVTDPKKAVFTLKWVVHEMENRYRTMNIAGVKHIQSFNNKISKYILSGKKLFREIQTGFDEHTKMPIIEKKEMPLEHMPLIVVIIDEMADLMMVAGKEVEHSIQRLAQMARASGIHLIAATQRPSVDVITGTIKANFPSRISYRVASKFDSRTILNEMGAEQLLGSGDMLFLANSANLLRLHGGYISEKEIENVVNFINSQSTNEIRKDITKEIIVNKHELNFNQSAGNFDELYHQAVAIIIQHQKASTSFLQRHLQIGYNRAARIIEQLEKEGIVTEASHAGKRSVLKKSV